MGAGGTYRQWGLLLQARLGAQKPQAHAHKREGEGEGIHTEEKAYVWGRYRQVGQAWGHTCAGVAWSRHKAAWPEAGGGGMAWCMEKGEPNCPNHPPSPSSHPPFININIAGLGQLGAQ